MTYLGGGDPARSLTDYYPAWLDNLAADVTVEGSAMDGIAQGPEAVRTILVAIRTLYEYQEFNFVGPVGDNGLLEDYTAQVRGEPMRCVVLVTRNAAGQTQHIVANYRPHSSLLLLSRLVLSADARRAYEQLNTLYTRRRANALMMGTRPQTLYGLADSPVGLAAWLLDHGDGWGQPAAPVTSAVLGYISHGRPAGDLTRDDVLDNITLYWVTNTGVSSARLYWENKVSLYNDADVSIPAAVSVFPGENYQAPGSWTERACHNLIYYNELDKGGHFAVWEQPQLFSAEVRAGFRLTA